MKNPNTGDHVRGDKNPMKRADVLEKVSGSNHWRNRPENKERAEEYCQEQKERLEEKSPAWKGGKTVSSGGYILIRINGEYVREQRFVMEQHLGRSLKPSEVIHHKNGNIQDNRIENLKLMFSQAAHVAHHNRQRKALSLDSKDAPFCKCGCGSKVSESRRTKGVWNKFIVGHSRKRRP